MSLKTGICQDEKKGFHTGEKYLSLDSIVRARFLRRLLDKLAIRFVVGGNDGNTET